MVVTVNIHEAKTHLSRLLEQVSGGQEIVIAKSGKPIARLVPIQGNEISLGFLKGKLHVSKNFDAPLSDEILGTFYGTEPTPDPKR